jgi:ribonuclease HII
MICGIDEAGRGPVLGDLVIAGLCCKREDEDLLREIGVKDSKVLSPSKREEIYETLVSRYPFEVVVITPAQLDKLRQRYSLNEIEASAFADIINRLQPSSAFVDCAGVSETGFAKAVKRGLRVDCSLVVEHKADERYPVVAAGSILAKVIRDRGIRALSRMYGAIGSGYPSDPVTVEFLHRWIREHRSYPPFARKSWKTSSRAGNLTLHDF